MSSLRKTIPTSKAEKIIRDVAEAHDVAMKDVIGDNRTPHIIRARQEAYLALYEAGCSYASIGYLMQRHHTTVMSGIRKLRAEASRDT